MDEPIVWPRVTLDGIDIEVRYSMGFLYRASKAGINVGDMANAAKNFSAVMDLLALTAKPVLEGLGKPVLSGEEWADKLQDTSQYIEVAKAFGEAYRLSVKAKPVESPNPQEPAKGLPN